MDAWVLIVSAIRPEAKDTTTIFLKRADEMPFVYRAGQFLTFLFSFQGRQVRRSYSFSSAPGIDATASITVKRVVNGEVSRYLLDHLKVGDELLALPPAGRFVLADGEQEGRMETGRLVFIAAGSGIVPVFSLIKKALHQGTGQVTLLTQQHDETSVIFKQQLEELTQRYNDRFRWVSWLSADGSRLNNWLLEEWLGRLLPGQTAENALFYICGPESFMRMATFTLKLIGCNEAQIKKEHFTVEYVPPPPLLTDTTPKNVTVRTDNKTYRFETAWPKTILQAALDNHIPLPYSCKGGRCSSCVARCIKGSVKMSINEVLTEKDLKDGLVLTCVGYAETEVEIVLTGKG
ncbi:MAG: ferredoxin--NADP reductase [Chitinophagaceae bacterium]|nr:ferredoxin--NADP reductase [Chitinophagaceae bacterium]